MISLLSFSGSAPSPKSQSSYYPSQTPSVSTAAANSGHRKSVDVEMSPQDLLLRFYQQYPSLPSAQKMGSVKVDEALIERLSPEEANKFLGEIEKEIREKVEPKSNQYIALYQYLGELFKRPIYTESQKEDPAMKNIYERTTKFNQLTEKEKRKMCLQSYPTVLEKEIKNLNEAINMTKRIAKIRKVAVPDMESTTGGWFRSLKAVLHRQFSRSRT